MQRIRVWALGFILVLVLALSVAPAPDELRVSIIHLGDTHSMAEAELLTLEPELGLGANMWLGGFDHTVAVIRRLRSQVSNALVLHSGDFRNRKDNVPGYSPLTDAAIWNHAGVDAAALGNHDTPDDLKLFAAWTSTMQFPLLAANLSEERRAFMGTAAPLAYTIKDFGGQKIGIIGATPGSSAAVAARAIQKAVDELEARGIFRVVLLSHLGLELDILVASRVRGLGIIVGGHSHSLLGDWHAIGLGKRGTYPLEVPGKDDKTVLLVHAWEFGKVVGNIELLWRADGTILDWQAAPVIVASKMSSNKTVAGLALDSPDLVVQELIKQRN
jgi:5'-nucleotidase